MRPLACTNAATGRGREAISYPIVLIGGVAIFIIFMDDVRTIQKAGGRT
jgi:hypothetical protein